MSVFVYTRKARGAVVHAYAGHGFLAKCGRSDFDTVSDWRRGRPMCKLCIRTYGKESK